MLEKDSVEVLREALEKLDSVFCFPAGSGHQLLAGAPRLPEVLDAVAERLHDNFPYFHPLYAGQMLKPPHPVARLAYALAQWINPNNHALDGGRASSAMEKEAVAELASMFGWQQHLGHLTSGGTMANLEALWVAGQWHPGKTILASEQAHYTHSRISGVLQLPFEAVRVRQTRENGDRRRSSNVPPREEWEQWWRRWARPPRVRWIRCRNSCASRKIWISRALRRRIWRIFRAGRNLAEGDATRVRTHKRGGFDCD